MYHSLTPFGAEEARCLVVSWRRTRVPGGARGVRLKLKSPKEAAYAKKFGWRREYRRRFNVMSHWGNNLFHFLDWEVWVERGYSC